ncbi:N-acetylmuramoyl-L-alanine amidase [Burkholderia pseudomallei]
MHGEPIDIAFRKPQAASRKPQAASRKPQAASRKPQAFLAKHRRPAHLHRTHHRDIAFASKLSRFPKIHRTPNRNLRAAADSHARALHHRATYSLGASRRFSIASYDSNGKGYG